MGILPMNDSNFIENVDHPAPPPWVMIVGICFAVLTLLFLMALTIMSVIGYRIECQSRFLIVTVFAFGAALSTAFLGGDAAAKGRLPLPFIQEHPIEFSAAGGVAILMLLMILGRSIFVTEDCSSSTIDTTAVNSMLTTKVSELNK